jgi:Bacterial PH domain
MAREVSYDDLMRLRPSSNVAEIFPARYLPPGEELLYSTRPSFIGFIVPRLVLGLFATSLLAFLLFVLLSQSASSGFPPGFSALFYALLAIMAVAACIGPILVWWFTCYAITTSRVVVKHGAWNRQIIDIPHGAVQSVVFRESAFGRAADFGTLQFSSASVAGFSLSPSGSRAGVINWLATPHPLETRAFYETVKRIEFD